LAKELGVKSPAIVQKCHDEGLDVKNHMSTISAGLAATIREWFSEGDNVTTVETTEKVNLKKVRVRKKVKRKRVPKATAKIKVEEPAALEVSESAAVAETVAEAAAVEETVVEEVPKGPQIVEHPEPEPVVPAGPLLEKPAPAQLSGPKVIRVEEPEDLRPAKPKPRLRYDAPVTEPLMYDESELGSEKGTDSEPKKGGPGHRKDRTHGRRSEQVAEFGGRRSRSTGWRQRDIEERRARLEAAGGEGLRLRPSRKILSKQHAGFTEVQRPSKATINEPITVKGLSGVLAAKVAEIIGKLMGQGVMATANQVISAEVAELVALEFGTELTVEHKITIESQIREEFENRERKRLEKRSVVATMLGHVDHGKTSLLDKIRSTNVTSGEAGGITQHIGAYQVRLGERRVTFLDTPGHEAFTAMRARGANMTDVVVLVIAADDGVMPQTVEAINHAKAAEVPVIVALNKIDLPGCDINRIYSQLAERDLSPTEWGGETEVVKTSAVTGEGTEDLLEHLDYIAELLELKADNSIPAAGWVVESKMSAKRGPVATLLVKEGRVKKGDVVLAGSSYGRVKVLRNSYGKTIKEATSSMPVEITGLNGVPQAGDRFYVLSDINRAKSASEEMERYSREDTLAERSQVTLDNLFSQIEAGNVKELNIIIRADVQGSVDVLTKYLSELSTEEVKVKILHASPGGITEGDVVLAEASNAIIIGFNVVSEDRAARLAEQNGVEIRLYNVIYRITEDLQKSMEGLLEPEETEKSLGRGVIRATFKVSRLGTIAGCYISDGVVTKGAKVRLIRDNVVVRDDLSIESLKHFKEDVREVKTGMECGIKLAKFDDVKEDDVFGFYEIVKVARVL
jgi:translation initiation factor IF-2